MHFFSLLPKLSLCPSMLNRNTETEFWVKEKKIACIALPGKGGHSRLMPSLGREWEVVLQLAQWKIKTRISIRVGAA